MWPTKKKKSPHFKSLEKKSPEASKSNFQLWLILHYSIIISSFIQLIIRCLSHHGRTSTEILYFCFGSILHPFWMTTKLNSNAEFGSINSYIAEMFAKKAQTHVYSPSNKELDLQKERKEAV